MVEKEIRKLNTDFEVTDNEFIEGYALKFNSWSDVLGGKFREMLLPDALTKTDMNNVVALFNHNDSQILGRSGVNMELEIDDVGLRYKIKPTQTSYTKDLMINLDANIINQSSFSMSGITDEWEDRGLSRPLERTIRSIDKLWDISIVTTPAYADTTASMSARSLEKADELITEREDKKKELIKVLLENTLKTGGN